MSSDYRPIHLLLALLASGAVAAAESGNSAADAAADTAGAAPTAASAANPAEEGGRDLAAGEHLDRSKISPRLRLPGRRYDTSSNYWRRIGQPHPRRRNNNKDGTQHQRQSLL